MVIAKSFNNYREALQGLCRVGRHNDSCKRYILNGVPLVDEDAYTQYCAQLKARADGFVK